MCYNHIQIEVSVIIKSGGLKMKKILALIMVVIVCVSLCACGNKKDKSNKSAQTEITGINDFKWGMTKNEVKKDY